MLENEEREKKNAEMLDLQKQKEKLEIDIDDYQVWSKLSIEEVAVLVTASRMHTNSGHRMADAEKLFGEIRNSQRKAAKNANKLETTARMTDSKIKKLKKDLRTPEEVKADEEALARRKRRQELWS